MKTHFALLSVLSLLLFGCSSVNRMPKVKLSNYTFETTPNDLDNVGFVFAVDNNKMQIPITMLNLDPLEGTIVVPKKSSTKEISFKALIKFLGIPQLNMPADAGINNTTKVTTTFSLESPKIYRAYLTQLDSAIQTKKKLIFNALKNQGLQDYDLYVVFETIKTSKLTYDFSKSKIGATSLDVTFQKIASMNDSIKWDNSGKGTLSYDLKKNLNVFYKIFKLNIEPGGFEDDLKRGEIIKNSEMIYSNVLNK